MPSKTRRGFTLIELMVVVAVMGILAVLVYPMYREQLLKTRRAEGWSLLLNAAQQEERFYTANNGYTAIVGTVAGSNGLGLAPSSPDGLSVTSQFGYYTLTAAVGSVATGETACTTGGRLRSCYVLSVTAQGAQAQDKDRGTTCFSLTLDSLGNKDSTSDGTTANGATAGGTPYCWSK